MTNKEWLLVLADIEDEDEKNRILNLHSLGHPERVKIADRLKDDLRALKKFLAPDSPPKICIRFKHCIQAVMGIGDAAKTGF